jgi:alanyl-tRNA synthetase
VPTVRLYHADSFARTFTARVLAHATHRGRPSIVLDQTHFYPEAGGQGADRGDLAGLALVDVQHDDDGTIHHVIAATDPPPAVGADVTGAIDWPRRRIHMALHTGQHVLSAALVQTARAATQSARLGEGVCTIDVARDPIPEAELARAEDLANAVIDDDLAIRAWFPEAAELAALPLRREPKVDDHVRVLAIGDFDYSPCGGTHCARTGQIGSIRILGTERYKGLTRISFVAGARARAELGARDLIVRGLATAFTCGPAELAPAVDKLRRELAATREALRDQTRQLAALIAAALAAAHPGQVIATVDGDAELARAVANRLVALGKDALLAAPGPDGTAVVIQRATGSALDCGALLGAIAKAHGGRGGGRPERAEGRLPTGLDWAASVAAARA